MIIGELDLERAQHDPAYLARVKAFLASADRTEAAHAGDRGPRQAPSAVPRIKRKTATKAA